MKISLGTMAFAAAAVSLSAVAATAADLPVRVSAPAPVFVSAPFSWNGFYVGLHAGYGWARGDVVGIRQGGAFRGDIGSVEPRGFVGGGQVGYNLQYGSLVYGIEGDISFSSANARTAGLAAAPALFSTARAKEDVFGSIRARFGFAADRALFYVTGGVGFTNVKYSLTTGALAAGGVPAWSGSSNSTRVGWVAGAGIEYAITNNVTARLEGLYYDLRRYTVRTTVLPLGGPATTQSTQSHGLVRLGLNYKF